MDFNQISVVIGLFTLISGAGVYFYSTVKKGRRDYLRADNADLTNSNTLLRQKIESLEESVKTLSVTVEKWREVATQTPEVKQLIIATSEQQAVTAKQHVEIVNQLAGLSKEFAKLTMEFSRVAQAITTNSRAQDKNSVAQDKNSVAQDENTRSRDDRA